MRFRVGGLSRALWGVLGSRERGRGDLRENASMRFSGEGPGSGVEWSGLGLGLANSPSNSRLKSWRSL